MEYVNQKDLKAIQKSLDAFDAQREKIIIGSRAVTKSSKNAITALHRGDVEKASSLLKDVEKTLKGLWKTAVFGRVGAYRAGVQEYVEAKCFLHFVQKKKLLAFGTFKHISEEDYLLGLCDLTGELARRAVLVVVDGNVKDVKEIRGFVQAVHDFFLQLHLRNGELRKKYDSIKWNLKKIESVAYDLEMKK